MRHACLPVSSFVHLQWSAASPRAGASARVREAQVNGCHHCGETHCPSCVRYAAVNSGFAVRVRDVRSASRPDRTLSGVDATTAATLGAHGRHRPCRASPCMPCASRSACSTGCRRRRTTRPRFPTASPTSSLCCGPAASSSTRPTRVVNNSPGRRRERAGRGQDLTQPELLELARLVRRDGVIREVELELPKGLGRSTGASSSAPASRRSALGARPAARRRPQRGAPARGDPARLRRQRLPRAEDPGRRSGPPRRGRARRARRPRGGGPVRPADAGRVPPADPAGPGDRRPLAAAGRRLPQRTAPRRPGPRGPRGRRPVTGSPPRTRTSRSPS